VHTRRVSSTASCAVCCVSWAASCVMGVLWTTYTITSVLVAMTPTPTCGACDPLRVRYNSEVNNACVAVRCRCCVSTTVARSTTRAWCRRARHVRVLCNTLHVNGMMTILRSQVCIRGVVCHGCVVDGVHDCVCSRGDDTHTNVRRVCSTPCALQ
jgi:hypothetical protein